MTDNVKEIRSILVGRTTYAEDGRLRALEKGEFFLASGVTDGAGSVRFFGISRRATAYQTDLPEDEVMDIADRCMMDIGRRIALKEQPDAAACLIRYVITRPVILVFKYVDGEPVLTAWSGAGPSGLISIIRAMNAFASRLPEDITPSEGDAPEKALEKDKKKRRGLLRRKKKEETEEEKENASKETDETEDTEEAARGEEPSEDTVDEPEEYTPDPEEPEDETNDRKETE